MRKCNFGRVREYNASFESHMESELRTSSCLPFNPIMSFLIPAVKPLVRKRFSLANLSAIMNIYRKKNAKKQILLGDWDDFEVGNSLCSQLWCISWLLKKYSVRAITINQQLLPTTRTERSTMWCFSITHNEWRWWLFLVVQRGNEWNGGKISMGACQWFLVDRWFRLLKRNRKNLFSVVETYGRKFLLLVKKERKSSLFTAAIALNFHE